MKRLVKVFELEMKPIPPYDTVRTFKGTAFYVSATASNVLIEWQDGTIEAVPLDMVQFAANLDERPLRRVQVREYMQELDITGKKYQWVLGPDKKVMTRDKYEGSFHCFLPETDSDGEVHPVAVVEDSAGRVETVELNLVQFLS